MIQGHVIAVSLFEDAVPTFPLGGLACLRHNLAALSLPSDMGSYTTGMKTSGSWDLIDLSLPPLSVLIFVSA